MECEFPEMLAGTSVDHVAPLVSVPLAAGACESFAVVPVHSLNIYQFTSHVVTFSPPSAKSWTGVVDRSIAAVRARAQAFLKTAFIEF